MLYQSQYLINTDRISAEDAKRISENEIAVQIGGELVKNIPFKVEQRQEGHFNDEIHTCRIHVYTEEKFKEIIEELRLLKGLGYHAENIGKSIFKLLHE